MSIVSQLTDFIDSSVPARLQPDAHRQLEQLSNLLSTQPEFGSVLETQLVQQTLPRVWVTSLFAARQCLQHPELFWSVFSHKTLTRPYDSNELKTAVSSRISRATDYDNLAQLVRQIRNEELVRIAWRDLAGWASLDEVLTTLSDLADSLVDGCLTKLYNWHTEAKGTPRSAATGDPVRLTVLGMGKLGAHELNFSSDIDLIFCYSDDGETDSDKAVPNQVFFTQLARKLIAVLNDMTVDGFVFRVDMRLRPFGDSGPLVMNFGSVENYYQIHGREWERYALIKARPIAGDIQSGNRLLKTLKPFIFRRYLDYGTIDSLRDMKRMIAAEVQRKELVNHVKLGAGGIREIEFIGQALQLVHGGRNADLQHRGILTILNRLQAHQIIPQSAATDLSEAYNFLRRTEHCLQMVNDQQTHSLPRDATEQARIAFAMKFDNWDAFHDALSHHLTTTQSHFAALFEDHSNNHANDALLTCWNASQYSSSLDKSLIALGFESPEQAFSLLQGMKNGAKYRSAAATGRERLEKLLPLLSEKIVNSSAPDRLLPRLVALLEAILSRSAYISLLIENEHALEQVIRLFSLSPWIASWITVHPILLDRLLHPATLYAPIDANSLSRELDARLSVFDDDDLENQMNALRDFRHAFVLQVAASELAIAERANLTGQNLSEIAETICQKAFDLAHSHVSRRFGQPTYQTETGEVEAEMMVVAFGKLGSRELGFGSDLDLVFVHTANDPLSETNGEKSVANSVYFTKICQRFIHILGANTSSGVAYEIDTRLRPNGNSGPPTTSLSAFETYQLTQAWTWEHQALVRARVIVGSKQCKVQFEAIREKVLRLPRDIDKLRTDILEMRQRLLTEKPGPRDSFDPKCSRGGLYDIEFISQYLVLRHAHEHPEMINETSTLGILHTACDLGFVTTTQYQRLSEAFRTFLHVSRKRKLADDVIEPDEDNHLVENKQRVIECWEAILLGA